MQAPTYAGGMLFSRQKVTLIEPDRALAGRDTPVLRHPVFHEIFGNRLDVVPAGSEVAYFGLGCFWGAEKLYWQTEGVTLTAAGYQGGYTPNPTYDEVCSARTGHVEVVKVAFDPKVVSYADLLKIFFENHNPTQGMRQGHDVGTQYRSVIYPTTPEQAAVARQVRDDYTTAFVRAGYGEITTEITEQAPEFFYAEDYHQQYLSAGKNPNGYCPVHATGVTCS